MFCTGQKECLPIICSRGRYCLYHLRGQSFRLSKSYKEIRDINGELPSNDMEIGRLLQGKYYFYQLDVDIIFINMNRMWFY